LTKEDVLQGLASFYFDLTAATSHAQLDAMLRLVPHTQLLMGFDLPYMDEEWIEIAKEQLFSYEHLTPNQQKAICSGNAASMFPGLRLTQV
jgi:6-methylsalicylate decarboxylase